MDKDIISSLRPAFVITLLFAALLGLVYPLAMTGIGLKDPAKGLVVGAVDTFILNRLLSSPGPVVFVNNTLPSLFRVRKR